VTNSWEVSDWRNRGSWRTETLG